MEKIGKLGKLQLTAKVMSVKSYEEGVQRVLNGSCNVFFQTDPSFWTQRGAGHLRVAWPF